MVDGIPIEVFNGVGVVGLVVMLGWLVASGRWFPKGYVEKMEAQYQRELDDIGHDRDEWRAAHRISEQARVEEREHNRGLVEDMGATVTSFLAGFRSAAEEATRDRTGGSS